MIYNELRVVMVNFINRVYDCCSCCMNGLERPTGLLYVHVYVCVASFMVRM